MAERYPPMPEARIVSYQTNAAMRTMELRTYSEFDMRAFADAARAMALEEAVRACRDVEEPAWHTVECPNTFPDGVDACVDAIRLLKQVGGEG